MFGVKKFFVAMSLFALATTLPINADVAPTSNVTTFAELNSAIQSSLPDVYIQNNLNADRSAAEIHNDLRINGQGFDINGNMNESFINYANLRITNVGTINEDNISSGFNNFIGSYGASESLIPYQMAGNPYGGVISNNYKLEVSNSVFVENMSTQVGGAIYNTWDGNISSLDNVHFYNNESMNGGAIGNIGEINRITNSTFFANLIASLYLETASSNLNSSE